MEILEKKKSYNNEAFERIKHMEENGVEYWCARELMEVLEYNKWANFEKVIEKAMQSCENSGINAFDHFADAGKMVLIGSGATKVVQDYKLTRYAC